MIPRLAWRTTLLAAALCATAATCGGDAMADGGAFRTNGADGIGARAFRHVETLVGFGSRETGSEGWRKAIEHMTTTLRGFGLEPVVDRWHVDAENLTFANVIVTLPGRLPDRIVIGCHHDTKQTHGHDAPEHNFPFVGANDSGSGVGLLLELAGLLAEQKDREVTYELVFFDGEESRTWEWNHAQRALFGSRRYVRQQVAPPRQGPRPAPIRAFVLLDMVGATDLQIDDDDNSDPVLKHLVGAAAKALGHERYFFAKRLAVADDHIPFVDAGIPAIDLIDLANNPQWHTPDDTLEHMSPRSMQIVGEVVWAVLPAIERRFVPALRNAR